MLVGKQSWNFDRPPVIIGAATAVGPDEAAGPLGKYFDIAFPDTRLGEKTWEKAEKKLMETAAQEAIKKAGVEGQSINFFVGGDLMNQIISASFAARTLEVPYLGVFGACSTAMESLALGALIVSSGSAQYVLAGTCSHNCTVEKQFRYPTEYGAQKPPTAQFTVTGAGAAVLAPQGIGPRVTRATIGKVVDMGIKDPFNMGAAMAPAAVNTIEAHFREFNLQPDEYDLVITGDLATVGHQIATELFKQHAFPIEKTTFQDCGILIYDRNNQDVQAGGSGCGCSASVTYGYLLKQLAEGKLKKILVVATGALLSPLSYQQGETIPCIAHAVAIVGGRGN